LLAHAATIPLSTASLARLSPSPDRVVYRAARLLCAILDGTLSSIDRVAADRPYYSGGHKRRGVNIQVLAEIPVAAAPAVS
jgi:hypothetical protein